MGKKFRTSEHNYCIYAIVDDIQNTVFIGKTYAKNPRAHYLSHMRLEHPLTANDYINADLTEPECIILEYIACTGSIAFRHILAWYLFFEKYKYESLTEEKVATMLEYPHALTRSIYNEVCAPYTLEEVMNRKVSKPIPPINASTSKQSPKADGTKLTQLNIRVQEYVKSAFKAFCSEHQLTQSDALQLLLLGADFNQHDWVMQQYLKKQSYLEQQLSEARQTIEKLTTQAKEEQTSALKRKKEWVNITKTILQHIIDKTCHKGIPPLHPQPFKTVDARNAFRSYPYPTEAGTCNIWLEQLIWSETLPTHRGERRNAALFILGINEDGEAIKLRWYPNKDFVGIYPNDPNYAYYQSHWLVGYSPAKDGAMSLISAVPYDCLPMRTFQRNHSNQQNHPSLDNRIKSANAKRTNQ